MRQGKDLKRAGRIRARKTGRGEIEKLLEIGRRVPAVSPGLAAGYLPSFESVIAVTSNSAAVMTTVGVYESARLCANADLTRRGLRVHFNQDAMAEALISLADHGARLPPAIRFREPNGKIGHTTYLTNAADMWVLECLALSATSHASPVISQSEYDPASMRATVHQDGTACVDRQVIPHLLAYVSALRLPLTWVLNNEACIHCSDGPLDDIRQTGDMTVIRTAQTTLSFDQVLIGAWHVRPADTDRECTILEAVCPQNRRLFYLTSGPGDCGAIRETWNAILQSLPKSRNMS